MFYDFEKMFRDIESHPLMVDLVKKSLADKRVAYSLVDGVLADLFGGFCVEYDTRLAIKGGKVYFSSYYQHYVSLTDNGLWMLFKKDGVEVSVVSYGDSPENPSKEIHDRLGSIDKLLAIMAKYLA